VSGTLDDEAEKAIRIHSRALVGTAGFAEQDLDDVRQEMRLEVITRLPKFDPRRAQRSTFITRIIERKARQLIRHRKAEKRDRRHEAYSLDATVKDAEGRGVARQQLLSEPDQTRRVKRRSRLPQYRRSLRENMVRAIASLAKDEQTLCRLVQRFGLKRLHQGMGMPPGELDARVKRIRRHLSQAGMHAYLEE
jgi:RNA polymerase sigma factor (sigma-70 family)